MTPRPLPSTRRLLAPLALGACVILVTATLTGCAQIMNELQRVHEEDHTSYEIASREWVGVEVPAWIPDDATALHNLATLDETQSVIRITTTSDPVGCEEGERTGLPFESTDWAPADALETDDGSLVASVLVCGPYEVAPYGDGWLGWFSASEEGETPDDAA